MNDTHITILFALVALILGVLVIRSRNAQIGLDHALNEIRSLRRSKETLSDRISNLAKNVDLLMRATGGLWKTADGDFLAIRDMTDSHIDNAIEHLKATKRTHLDSMRLLVHEKERRAYGRKIDAKLLRPVGLPLPEPVDKDVLTYGDLTFGEEFRLANNPTVYRKDGKDAAVNTGTGTRVWVHPAEKVIRLDNPEPEMIQRAFSGIEIGGVFYVQGAFYTGYKRYTKVSPTMAIRTTDGARHTFAASWIVYEELKP